MRRAMQAILLAPDPVMRAAAERGDKTITIREGHRDYTPGPAILCYHVGLLGRVLVDITSVRHTTVGEVTDEEWLDDGTTPGGGLELLRRHYPDIGLDDPVTVIRWEGLRVTLDLRADERPKGYGYVAGALSEDELRDIAEDAESRRMVAMLCRAYRALSREGWEEGESSGEFHDELNAYLDELGIPHEQRSVIAEAPA